MHAIIILMTKKHIGILALLISVILWGPAPVITKLALLEIPQFSLALLRSVMAIMLVFIFFFPKGYFRIQKRDLLTFVLAGLFGSVFNIFFFFIGIQHTSATSSQAIFTVSPVMTALLAHFILHEKIKTMQFIGVFIALIGAIMVALRSILETGNLNLGSTFGNFLVFLAALSWVGYILYSKRLSKKGYSPITITSYSFVVALLAFLPLALWENLKDSSWVYSLGPNGWVGIFYQGIFASVLAFLAYQTGLKLTSAFTAGVILYLNPIVTTLVAVPVLGEQITTPFIIGATLIIVGSFIATQLEFVKHHVRKYAKT